MLLSIILAGDSLLATFRSQYFMPETNVDFSEIKYVSKFNGLYTMDGENEVVED